jgi:K+-sensing histidine kinase KdpD
VPEQRLEKVFEPHFRLAGQQQGYGLGLGIARNIAHSHGGEVSLQNLREGACGSPCNCPAPWTEEHHQSDVGGRCRLAPIAVYQSIYV